MHQPSEVLALTQEDTQLRSCYTESTDSVIWPLFGLLIGKLFTHRSIAIPGWDLISIQSRPLK